MVQRKIHWLGAGLASGPGLRRLIHKGFPTILWEMDLDRAARAVKGLEEKVQIREAAAGALQKVLEEDDIVVSMLPASHHMEIAKLCLEKKAHFVSSSYISPDMANLNRDATESGLSFVNEVGLDPGIDHMLAHLLVSDYRSSACFDPENSHDFQSHCGGFPKVANDFRYKFSWSPLGVIKALKSPARAIMNGKEIATARPWSVVRDQQIALPGGVEMFESYPNRDSLDFLEEYGFDQNWKLAHFERGTLRLAGWSDAWAPIFELLDHPEEDQYEQHLQEVSDQLWQKHAYHEGEYDRVVLSVALKVSRNGHVLWHKTKSIDAVGNAHTSAMARLVSLPVSLAVEGILSGDMPLGVQAAPKDPALIRRWLETLSEHGDQTYHNDLQSQAALIAAE